MNGILLVDKPSGYTSRDIVNIVGKILKTKKIGHTGTLDPLASGVLILCIGSYTKLVDIITSTSKEYIADIMLGINTDTLDIEGEILNDCKCIVEKEKIIDTLNTFIGCYNQEVPIYSAVKIEGKKLYEYARENIDIKLPSRNVEIKNIELLDIKYENNKTIIKIKTLVSKGTYIRSLSRDIGDRLNTYGCMSSLRRTMQGKFKIEDTYTLEDIKNNNCKLLDINDIFDYKTVYVDNILEKKISNGVPIKNTYNEEYIIFKSNNLLCIYKNDNGILKMYKKLL